MGICIEIQKKDDGTFVVSECAPKEEMAEMGEEEGGQTLGSLEEALSVVMDLMSGETGAHAEDAMAAAERGYGPAKAPMKQTPGRVFGEE